MTTSEKTEEQSARTADTSGGGTIVTLSNVLLGILIVAMVALLVAIINAASQGPRPEGPTGSNAPVVLPEGATVPTLTPTTRDGSETAIDKIGNSADSVLLPIEDSLRKSELKAARSENAVVADLRPKPIPPPF